MAEPARSPPLARHHTPSKSMSSAPLTTSTSSHDPLSPLMANLNRLSLATSRPNLPSQEGYTTRAMRRVSSSLGFEPERASEELDDLITRRIQVRRSSANVDTTSILYPTLENHPAPANHPLLVLNLAAIANVPAFVGNDELLEIVLRRLEPWVGEEGEGGYCLIVFAAEDTPLNMAKGGPAHTKKGRALPGVAWWLWHWRRIPRKFRKNLKRLYIVHPSTLTRTVLPLILPLVSPKSHVKVHTVPSLLALTHFNVSLRGMDLPISTLAEEARVLADNPDAARRSSITNAAGGRPSVTLSAPPSLPVPAVETGIAWGTFSALTSVLGTATSWLHPGVAEALTDKPQQKYWAREIDDIVAENQGHVPRVVGAIGNAIITHCTTTEGIFRRSANTNLVHTLQALLDLPLHLQPRLNWAAIAKADPLLLPIVLKKILAALTTPIFPPSTYPIIRNTRSLDDIATKLLPAISDARIQLLSVILHLAHHLLPYEPTTRMGSVGLALMLAPSLISGPDPREDLPLLMEFGMKIPAGLGLKQERKNSNSSSGSEPEPSILMPQTLVGVLQMWITDLPALHGKTGPCDCRMGAQPAAVQPTTAQRAVAQAAQPTGPPLSPRTASGQHALLNGPGGVGTSAPPVETASS